MLVAGGLAGMRAGRRGALSASESACLQALSDMQDDGPSANGQAEVEALLDLLFETVGRQARQRLLKHLDPGP